MAVKLTVRVRRTGALGVATGSFEFKAVDHESAWSAWEDHNRDSGYLYEPVSTLYESEKVRTARVERRAVDIDTIQNYLPGNYTAKRDGDDVVITGTDNAGWTLDSYVIPRLASGLIWAKEDTD